jgi:hypothetical protein
MKNIHYSRKQRQLKFLVKKLNLLLEKTDTNLKLEIKKITSKIKLLVIQLNGIISTNRIKHILGGIALLIGVSFTNTANAQWYAYPVQDPFNLQNGYDTQVNTVEFADIDNDGDYDFLSGEYTQSGYSYSLKFHFQENIGSATNPNFSAPTAPNPFGLVSYNPSFPNLAIYQWFKIIDLDNDGDFDILSNVVSYNINQYSINTDFLYYENIGTASSPQFSTPQTNPFGLSSSPAIVHTGIGDIDNDGDLDLVGFAFDNANYTANSIFIENTGTTSSPNFTTPQLNQFGLPSGVFSLITLEDIDNDGDLDIFFSDEDYNPYMSTIAYVENTGTSTAPQFTPPPTPNPLGLTFPLNWQGMAILNFKDLDGDNDNDLIAGTDDDMNLYFENVGIQQPVTYDCINYSCVDPGTGNGAYTTLSACQTTCIAPVTFECDWYTADCFDPGDGSGYYLSYSDCILDCTPEPTWDCVPGDGCIDPGNGWGQYFTEEDCWYASNNCSTWSCDATLGCVDPLDGSGLYTTLSACQANCDYTAVQDTEMNNLKLYPNPVNNTLNINSDKKIKKIEICDALGQVIYKETEPSSTINVQQLEAGLYYISIILEDNKKVIKKFTK